MVVRSKRHIALVSADDPNRRALVRYLLDAGFCVDECDELVHPSAFGALVWVGHRDTPSDKLVAGIRSWLKLTKTQRIVVVTQKPIVLKDLVAVHGDRLVVLAAPAFGWELVDALRAERPPRPRGA